MEHIIKIYDGRIGRKDYVLGLLFYHALASVIVILLGLLLSPGESSFDLIAYVIGAFFAVFIFSLHVRRSHDLGKSGNMVFLLFIPIVNLIIAIRLLFYKGQEGVNQYGDVPARDIKFFDTIFNRTKAESK